MKPRVLLDTNVLISYLLKPEVYGVMGTIISAFVQDRIILLVPERLLEELLLTVNNKPSLAERIPLNELQEFVHILRAYAESVARIQDPIPAVTRDPKDDYLLAYALVGKASHLVTGDNDLLVLQDVIDEIQILTPRAFVEQLNL